MKTKNKRIKGKRTLKKSFIYFLLIFSIFSCIDPIPPEFNYQSDLVVIDGLASTIPGTTFVNIKKTILEFGRYSTQFISGCNVTLINSDTKEKVSFVEVESNYLVSKDFRISPGSRWEMEVLMPNGKRYRSESELVPNEVPIDKISEKFTKELIFEESLGKYIAGHEISIDFEDPEEEQNFYVEAKRKSKGIIKFESCDNIEIPLDPAVFEAAADEIIASLNSFC